jgi:hypothetical protein
MRFRRHLLVQKAIMGSRGHLWDPEGPYGIQRAPIGSEGTYGIQRAPMGFRGHLRGSEGHYGIQRAPMRSRGGT